MKRIDRNSELAQMVRNNVRAWAGVDSTDKTPIIVVRTDSAKRYAPQYLGSGFYWTTPGGKRITYPNAYKWRKIYHPSTRRIEVSQAWIQRQYGVYNTNAIASK